MKLKSHDIIMKSLGREGLKCKELLQELENMCVYVLVYAKEAK